MWRQRCGKKDGAFALAYVSFTRCDTRCATRRGDNSTMRIELSVDGAQAQVGPSLPPPLARLSPSGELVLIELQGALEMEGRNPEGGQTIGKLTFPAGREDQPVLQISHHCLEGKLIKLTRPLAILEKRTRPRDETTPPSSPEREPEAVLEPEAPSSSPLQTPTRKRMRGDRLPQTPMRTGLSSSPMPERTVRLSEGHLDFSSPDSRAPAQRPPTVTTYHVLKLVRQKLLFSKRPEPIVRLENTG